MRDEMTRERLDLLMREIARTAPRGKAHRVYLVGGATAVYAGWRSSSIDVDLFSEDDTVFRDVQAIKERLNVNVEFVRPERSVPPLPGSDDRHVCIRTVGTVSCYHYDPYPARCVGPRPAERKEACRPPWANSGSSGHRAQTETRALQPSKGGPIQVSAMDRPSLLPIAVASSTASATGPAFPAVARTGCATRPGPSLAGFWRDVESATSWPHRPGSVPTLLYPPTNDDYLRQAAGAGIGGARPDP